jgi:very-short-patch-repair endonuclease
LTDLRNPHWPGYAGLEPRLFVIQIGTSHETGIEYDGAVHRTTLVGDDRRQNNLLRAGVRLLRFTSVDVLQNPASVVLQVRAALASTYSS